MRYEEKLKCLRLEGGEPPKDYLSVLMMDRILIEIYDKAGSGKGKNSSVFLAIDPNGEEPDYVVKFCNDHDKLIGSFHEKKRLRFDREIRALLRAIEYHKDAFLLNIVDHGTEKIDGYSFKYYVMEKADYDLGQFLAKEKISLQQKIVLCDGILKALRALHELDIYHRDLKPDNIFFVGDQWKIGDLGFIAFREEDFDIDDRTEKIGPTGLLSPEATNKAFANRNNPEFEIDCLIDDKSDVFQLGKLFWYIFQGDIPTGQLINDDFRIGDLDIFNNIIIPMLQYAKLRRPNIVQLDNNFEPIRKKFAVV